MAEKLNYQCSEICGQQQAKNTAAQGGGANLQALFEKIEAFCLSGIQGDHSNIEQSRRVSVISNGNFYRLVFDSTVCADLMRGFNQMNALAKKLESVFLASGMKRENVFLELCIFPMERKGDSYQRSTMSVPEAKENRLLIFERAVLKVDLPHDAGAELLANAYKHAIDEHGRHSAGKFNQAVSLLNEAAAILQFMPPTSRKHHLKQGINSINAVLEAFNFCD